MEYKNYYRILGVDRNASKDEIKRAYRRLARELHPDVNPDDPSAEDRFKDINAAYEVLSDPGKRRRYDQLGAGWNRWQQTQRKTGGFDDFTRQWYGQSGSNVHFADLNDLFGQTNLADLLEGLFGGGGPQTDRRPTPRRGQDVEIPVELTLEEAYCGTTRPLEQGDGSRATVKIPPGVQTGARIRLTGQGKPGIGGGPPGDLYLKVRIQPHSTFRLKGRDLWRDVEIDLYTAVLGGEVPVETPQETVMLKIPPGTSSGRTFRLRGKGMPSPGGARNSGDLYAISQIQVPSRISREERALFEELAQMNKGNYSAPSGGLYHSP
jgi:curved DNA-binding protein